ncbi:MAG: hypothetical protein HY264_07110 [Chloroflexi bacterium]|nr:hypothetical protein [Chloroflexota bacterium]
MFRLTLAGGLLAGIGFATYAATRRVDGSMLQGLSLYASLAIAGWLILRLRPASVIGRLMAVTAFLVALVADALGVLALYGVGAPIDRSVALGAFLVVWLLFSLQLPFALFILLFPDGRLPGPRWRLVARLGAGAGIGSAVILTMAAPPGQLPANIGITVAGNLAGPLYHALDPTPLPAIANAIGVVLLLGALVALISRYRAGPQLLRQQIKWFVAGTIASVGVGLLVGPFEAQPGFSGTAARAIDIVASPLPLLGLAAGAVRYRLWDIDVVLTRAASVGIVWLGLAAASIPVTFGAGVIIVDSDPRALLSLLLALVVSAAFPQLRKRIEATLTYRLGLEGSGYHALRRLSDPDPRSRDTDIGRQVVETACDAVGAAWAAAWLVSSAEGEASLRPLAANGLDPQPSFVLSSKVLGGVAREPRALLWADLPVELSAELDALRPLSPAAIATLRAGPVAIGLLAIGERRTEPIEASDLEVLAALGREVGLILQNNRLQLELEARLVELGRYGREIRESRARIVAAQDDERRRLERDLHDGVQQQLVNLAARLRRASLRPPGEQAGLLTDLAGEAEAAVFALRELGRGIYPTILTDLGLPAALQAAAARVPMDINVEIELSLANRRLGSDIETALYLVALEAMTNAQKHALGSRVHVSLGFDDQERWVVLTISDDGPGFIDRSSGNTGSGLQNMHDRVAAIGGSLEIQSALGGGTLIAARVPTATPAADVQTADSGGRPVAVDPAASRR